MDAVLIVLDAVLIFLDVVLMPEGEVVGLKLLGKLENLLGHIEKLLGMLENLLGKLFVDAVLFCWTMMTLSELEFMNMVHIFLNMVAIFPDAVLIFLDVENLPGTRSSSRAAAPEAQG